MRSRRSRPRSALWQLVPFVALMAAASQGCAATPDKVEPPSPQVQAAIDDAARVTGIAVAQLRVSGVQKVTWLDGSLGCPEPDLMYTQQLVPGLRIHIEAGGRTLEYHTDLRSGTFVLCPPERIRPPAPAVDIIQAH